MQEESSFWVKNLSVGRSIEQLSWWVPDWKSYLGGSYLRNGAPQANG